MKSKKWPFLLLALIIALPLIIQAQSKIELDVATIMQDPKTWVGSSPNRPFWSEDSKWIYFSWNPESVDADSLYKISARGGQAIKLTREERQQVIPGSGVYSRDYRYKLFTRNGDIFLYDIKRNSSLQITGTTARENNAVFSQDESAVIFRSGMNLFRWDRSTGATTQIIDFSRGKKPVEEPEPKTDSEKFVKHEETYLIQILQKRRGLRERTRVARKAESSNAPSKIYIGKKKVQSPVLSPDGKFVTVRLSQPANNAKKTIVPNYVTDSGFTEDLKTRTKVGSPQSSWQFAFVDLERDTLIYIKQDSLPGIYDKAEFTEVKIKSQIINSK